MRVLSPSTEQYDRGVKFIDCARHGVTEYWLIDPEQQIAEQYLVKNGTFDLEFKGKMCSLFSTAMAGFSIDATAIFTEQEALQSLQKIGQG